MNKSDQLGGLIWFVIGLYICIESVNLNLLDLQMPGPGFTPFLSGACLGLLGAILIISGISKKIKKPETEVRKVWGKKERKLFFITLLSLFGYIILLEPLGFIITSFLMLLFLFNLTEVKSWVRPLLIAVVTSSLSYLVFSVWLKCQFPRGIFKI